MSARIIELPQIITYDAVNAILAPPKTPLD